MPTQRRKRTEMGPEDCAELRLAALIALLGQKEGEPRSELLGRLGHMMRELARHEALIQEMQANTPISMDVLDDLSEQRQRLLSSLQHLVRHLDRVIDLSDEIETAYVDLTTVPF